MSDTEQGEKPDDQQKNESDSIDIDALKTELDKWKNDFLYLKAEFENFKKRSIKERSDLIKYGGEYAFIGILAVLDNFDRALKVSSEEGSFKSLKDGVELIAKEFRSVLQQYGVTEIPAQGARFDPALHDAVGSANSDTVAEGYVASVVKTPYKFHDKIIRAGQVIVSLGPKKGEKETSSEATPDDNAK